MNALSIQRLRKAFGALVVTDEVELHLRSGEILALIGPNGAGKTTLFNLINGQLRPDSGRIVLLGQSIAGLSPREIWRRGIGRTFQITATFSSMSVLENVQLALLSLRRQICSLLPRLSRQRLDEAFALLELVGMADQADRPCNVLAYGDLKRLELALALANAPKLLLMDEPTAGMAAKERAELMQVTVEIARERNIAVLFTEHDMDVVFGYAERIVVLDRGRILSEGPPAVVRGDARVRKVYLGQAPLRVAEGAGSDA